MTQFVLQPPTLALQVPMLTFKGEQQSPKSLLFRLLKCSVDFKLHPVLYSPCVSIINRHPSPKRSSIHLALISKRQGCLSKKIGLFQFNIFILCLPCTGLNDRHLKIPSEVLHLYCSGHG